MAFVTPKYVNYTTTASFANAITVPTGDICTAFSAINKTGEDVEITLDDGADTRWFVADGAALVVDEALEIKKNLRARYASGGSGAAGLHLTIWG